MGEFSRRGFLGAMMSAVASASALALEDPEKLLWAPGKKTIVDLGAVRQIQAPTLEQTVLVSAGPSYETARERDMAAIYHQAAAAKPLYMPDRYRIDLSDGTSLGFDSDWKLKQGYRGGQRLSDQEKARYVQELRTNRKINLRTMTLED